MIHHRSVRLSSWVKAMRYALTIRKAAQLPPIPREILFGLCALLLAYFLFSIFQGVVSRTVAVPAGGAVGLGLLGVGAHPGLAVVGALVAYGIVNKVVSTSIRWAATLAIAAVAGLAAYAVYTGQVGIG